MTKTLQLAGIGDTVIDVHQGDLPAGIDFGSAVAVDTETTGLRPHRDRLCLVQLSAGDGACHLVRFSRDDLANADGASHLKALLADPDVTKLFHFGRFDIGMLYRHLGVLCANVYCSKIASKLVRTYTDRHGLKDLCRELLGVEISKEQQTSDWGSGALTPEQLRYAAGDVLYLHRLRERLDAMLRREDRLALAEACFRFLPHRALLDVGGWPEEDIFAY
jgi:ribonuclease D